MKYVQKDLPEELESAIGDRTLTLNQQRLLEYLYEDDIQSVHDKCDRNELDTELGFSNSQSAEVTKSLRDAGLITIDTFDSKFYYTLATSTTDSERHHYQVPHEQPVESTGETIYSVPDKPTASPTTPSRADSHPTLSTQAKSAIEPPTATSKPSSRTQRTATSDSNQEPEATPTPQSSSPDSTPDTSPLMANPPKPALFSTFTIALTGFLTHLGILSTQTALPTFTLLTITYITALKLTHHNITPNDLKHRRNLTSSPT